MVMVLAPGVLCPEEEEVNQKVNEGRGQQAPAQRRVSFSKDNVTSDPAMVGLVTLTIEKNRPKISEDSVTKRIFFRRGCHKTLQSTVFCMPHQLILPGFAHYRKGLFLVIILGFVSTVADFPGVGKSAPAIIYGKVGEVQYMSIANVSSALEAMRLNQVVTSSFEICDTDF